MFRIVDPPPNSRQSASEWIYKMLFLWSREPIPDPRAGPWFAWFATAVLLWRCRRRITKAILAISPLRLLKRRAIGLAINQKMILKQQKRHSLAQLHKHKTVGIRRAKRLCTGDGPHVSGNISMIPQIHYRVTRSGRIYGKYPNKTAIPNGSIQESH
ncbi:uncharacterized protein [Mycetomoellerius zeteki]|nr:PREDICTED: uncharacterized protein LOC108726375 isoform X2 [Trachymyrmex zeteki]XP_018309386.1 PREDICTED: uncharacterized protein LOC108726375 isoform X2 [Trachymyrmex zeteki]XP_018309387.1 PREDICTED: uncharacterized protein LOC108726375 isoform X2 [Trachymyrmex zeteki]